MLERNTSIYLALAAMACDPLTIHESTVSSEAALDKGEKLAKFFKTELSPETVSGTTFEFSVYFQPISFTR